MINGENAQQVAWRPELLRIYGDGYIRVGRGCVYF